MSFGYKAAFAATLLVLSAVACSGAQESAYTGKSYDCGLPHYINGAKLVTIGDPVYLGFISDCDSKDFKTIAIAQKNFNRSQIRDPGEPGTLDCRLISTTRVDLLGVYQCQDHTGRTSYFEAIDHDPEEEPRAVSFITNEI